MGTPHTDWAVIPAAERERQVVAVLEAVCGRREAAESLAKSRFPMSPDEVISEVSGRGLDIDRGDLTAFLADRFNGGTFDDGEPITAEAIGWPRYLVEELISWCFLQGRGRMNGVTGAAVQGMLTTVGDMFRALRSRDLITRVAAGAMLGKSLGAGLGLMGESREDFECILLPQLSDLLGRTMAGDGAAADRLEALIVADPAQAYRPDARARAS